VFVSGVMRVVRYGKCRRELVDGRGRSVRKREWIVVGFELCVDEGSVVVKSDRLVGSVK